MRHAVLLVNNPSRSSRRRLVSKRDQDTLVLEIEDWLRAEKLGDERFVVHPIIDATNVQAYAGVNKVLNNLTHDDEVLFYYFGHGLHPQGRLHLFCRASRANQRSTMLPFRQVLEQVSGANLKRYYFILDCCYGGAAALDFAIEEIPTSRYFLMASAVGRAKAIIHGMSETEVIGAFTRELIYSTTSRAAIDHDRRIVTFSSLFEAASKELRNQFTFQEPTKAGDAGEEAFWSHPDVLPEIQEEPKDDLPKTSYYRKLLRLVSYLQTSDFNSEREFYAYARSLQHEEFLVKQRSEEEPPEFVRIDTFSNYVRLLKILNVVRENLPITLTEPGRRLASDHLSHFNSQLCDLVTAALREHGIVLPELERDIVVIFKAGRIPNMEEIHHRNFLRLRRLSKWSFKVLVDLLALTGALQWSSSRTYYPQR